jgi:hypothetical protein
LSEAAPSQVGGNERSRSGIEVADPLLDSRPPGALGALL